MPTSDGSPVSRASIRRNELLAGAARVFYEKGYASTTLQDLADEMGFTKPAIYYYAKNKEELLVDIYVEIVQPSIERAEDIAGRPTTGSERFQELVSEHLRTFLSNLETNAVFDVQVNNLSVEARQRIRELSTRYTSILTSVYTDGVRDGTLREADVGITINGILGMCNSVHRWYRRRAGGVDEVVSALSELVRAGTEAVADRP